MYKMQGVKWMLKYVEIVISPSRSQPLFVIEMLKERLCFGAQGGCASQGSWVVATSKPCQSIERTDQCRITISHELCL